jgi:hypothetical protein
MESWPERNRFQLSAKIEELLRFTAKTLTRKMGYNEVSKCLIILLLVFFSDVKYNL